MKESIFCHVLKERAQVKSFNRIAWNRFFFRPQFSFDIDNANIIPFVCIIFCCEHVLVNMARFVLQLCYIWSMMFFPLVFFFLMFFYLVSLVATDLIQLWNYSNAQGNQYFVEPKSDEHEKRQVTWTCSQLFHTFSVFRLRIFIFFSRSHLWLQSSYVNCKHWFPLPRFFFSLKQHRLNLPFAKMSDAFSIENLFVIFLIWCNHFDMTRIYTKSILKALLHQMKTRLKSGAALFKNWIVMQNRVSFIWSMPIKSIS